MNLTTRIDVSQGGATRVEEWTLLSLELREFLDRPYLLTVRVSTADEVPDAAAFLGARIHIEITDESGAELRTGGVLRESRYERTLDGRTHMRWTASPAVALSALQERARVFVDVTPLDIIHDVVGPALERFGGTLDSEALRLEHEAVDYCVQRGESDLDFVLRIMSSSGLFWTVDWTDEHEVVVLRDESLILSDPATNRMLPFAPSGLRSTPSVRELDYGVQILTAQHRATSWDWKAPVPTLLESRISTSSTATFGTIERSDLRRTVEAEAGAGPMLDATAMHAGHFAERAAMEATFVRARSDALELRPGVVFALEAHPNPDLLRDFLVTEVIHILDTDAGMDGEVTGFHYENALNAIPADVRYRPPVRLAPRVAGPETAVVVGDAKTDTVTDRFGRVRVRFHWAADQESCFIRVAQAWAGHGFGTLFVPRPGMEVVVHYLDGDPECPMITGSVYNAHNTPPYPLPEDRARTTLRTQTYPEGSGANELRFDDTKGRQQVSLKAQRRLDVCVSSSMYESVGRNRELRVGGKEVGDMNVFVRHDHNHLVSENDYQQVCKEQHRAVEGTAIDRVEVERRVSTGGAHTVDAETVLLQASDAVDQRATFVRVEGTNGVDVLGSHIAIEATHRMSLRAGDAFITLDPYEGIRLHGVTVGLNSGGTPTSAEAPSAAEEFELVKPIEAYGANCGCNAGKSSGKGGGGRQHARVNIAPHEPDPYPPGPFPPEKPGPEDPVGDCRVARLWAMCAHGRYTEEDFIEVVPDEGTDEETLDFTVDLSGRCEGDPSWSVFGTKSLGTGRSTTHTVTAPKWTVRWPPPQNARDFASRTLVMVTTPTGEVASKTVWAFPSKKTGFAAEVPLDLMESFIKPLLELELVKAIVEAVAKDAKFKPTAIRGYASSGFYEYWGPHGIDRTPRGGKTDNRVYFGYDVGFKFAGEFGGSAGIKLAKLGKLVTKALKVFEKYKYFEKLESFMKNRDLTADAVFSIKPDIDVEWLRNSPDDPLWVEPTKQSRLLNEIKLGFDLGLKLPVKLPFFKEYESYVELGLGVVAIVNFKGRPYLSAETLGADLRYELTDIKITNATLKPPFVDGIEKKDVSLLSQKDEDKERRSISFKLDASWILKRLWGNGSESP